MKLVIDISEERYEWVKKNNPNADTNSIVGAIANGTPYEEQSKGKWVLVRWMQYNCSECGYYYIGTATNYCPNCGARMESDV